jgi:F-type H+-transporting ATPase subunit b
MTMRNLILSPIALAVLTSPALAASGPFFSLRNTNFIVLLAFIVFVGILLYVKLPAKIGAMLDARAKTIQAELEEARALHDEAKAIMATYEAKSREVQAQSARIVEQARQEALAAAAQAKDDLKVAIARRIAAAEERIAQAEAGAVREVREKAVSVAVAAAGEILAKQMTGAGAAATIDASIAEVGAKLH